MEWMGDGALRSGMNGGRWKASDLCQQLLTEWWLKCWCPTAPPWAADNSRARRPPPRRSPATGWPSGTAGSRRRCSPSRRFRRCTRKSPCRSVKRENKNYIREFVFDKSLKPTSTELFLNFIWEILKNVWGVTKTTTVLKSILNVILGV